MTNKNFEKLKIVIGMQQCTPAPNFSQFGELSFRDQIWSNAIWE